MTNDTKQRGILKSLSVPMLVSTLALAMCVIGHLTMSHAQSGYDDNGGGGGGGPPPCTQVVCLPAGWGCDAYDHACCPLPCSWCSGSGTAYSCQGTTNCSSCSPQDGSCGTYMIAPCIGCSVGVGICQSWNATVTNLMGCRLAGCS